MYARIRQPYVDKSSKGSAVCKARTQNKAGVRVQDISSLVEMGIKVDNI